MPSHVKAVVFTSDPQGREDGDKNRLLGAPVAEALEALVLEKNIPEPDAIFLCGEFYDYPPPVAKS